MKEIKNGLPCNLLPVFFTKDEIAEKLGVKGNDKLSYSVGEGGYISEDGAVLLIDSRSPYIGMLIEARKCTDEEKEKWVRYTCELFDIDLGDYIDDAQNNAWVEYFAKLQKPTGKSETEPKQAVMQSSITQTPVDADDTVTNFVQPAPAAVSTVSKVKLNTTRKPNILGDTAGLSNDEWLEWRKHGSQGDIPYTLGGSDIATVFGVSPWKTPLELWLEKHGDIPRKEPNNPKQLAMGHLQEPVVAHLFGEETGLSYYEDTNLYQHPDYPWALANIDRRYTTEDGEDAILECKTTSFHIRDHWADGIPYYYELQVRFYMAVLNINHAAIACSWGFNPENDFKYYFIERDLEVEEMIFSVCQDFIDSLYAGEQPTMEGVKTDKALEALKRIYEKGNANLPPVEFGNKQGKVLERISELDVKIQRLKEELKAVEGQRDEYTVKIIEAMKDNEQGTYTAPDGTVYTARYPTKVTNRIDTARMKKDAPDLYKKWLKSSTSRTFSVKVTEPKNN
ncbi:MAG: YqaJ viral recombinase family protein [Oscillospiraceae bacterium]|nr:YqaJ viral recombinase family protein [Oscillospiraceae bacterium]